MKDIAATFQKDLARAIDGDTAAYEAVVAVPKEDAIGYFEARMEQTARQLPEDLFGFGKAYDIRGNAQPIKGGSVELTPPNVYCIGKLLGSRYATPGATVLLTGDIRVHTPILRYCMALGVASVGVDVDYAPDYLTTGAHNLLSTENNGGYAFMVQVSGSHGASPKNGFKIKVDLGKGILEPLYAERLEALYASRADIRAGVAPGVIRQISGLEQSVIEILDATLPPTTMDEIVVIDPRAGAAGPFITGLLIKRGFTIIDMDKVAEPDLVADVRRLWQTGKRRIAVMLNMRPDGLMGRGIWDPSIPEALEPAQRLIRLINADLSAGMPKAIGAVFDGDADRISAILEDGTAVPAFEMTLPYYQRFLIDADNQDAMIAIAKAGGPAIKIVCDVRANSKLLNLVDAIDASLRNKAGIARGHVVEGYFITTGYPPQLSFMQHRVAELDAFVHKTPALSNDAVFMRKFEHLKRTYFTAEASGHNFFHISKRYPYRVCDCAISGFFTLVHIRETMAAHEAPVIGLKDGKARYALTELFAAFPPAYSSREVIVSIPNDIKIATATKIGAWMKERFGPALKPFGEARIDPPESDYLMQPKDDGYVTVSGFKVQLRDGRSALVRWSNTSEKLTTIFEGKDRADLISITKEITERLRQEGTVDVGPLDKEVTRLKALPAGA